jgi:hypothetical protein
MEPIKLKKRHQALIKKLEKSLKLDDRKPGDVIRPAVENSLRSFELLAEAVEELGLLANSSSLGPALPGKYKAAGIAALHGKVRKSLRLLRESTAAVDAFVTRVGNASIN